MDKLHELHAALVVFTDNFRILHYRLIGPSYFDDHERYNGWYNEVSDWQDAVAELLLSFGESPESIVSAVELLQGASENYVIVDRTKNYSPDQADNYAKAMYDSIYRLIMEIDGQKDVYPSDVRSSLRKIAKDIRKVDFYQLRQRLTTVPENNAPEA